MYVYTMNLSLEMITTYVSRRWVVRQHFVCYTRRSTFTSTSNPNEVLGIDDDGVVVSFCIPADRLINRRSSARFRQRFWSTLKFLVKALPILRSEIR